MRNEKYTHLYSRNILKDLTLKTIFILKSIYKDEILHITILQ